MLTACDTKLFSVCKIPPGNFVLMTAIAKYILVFKVSNYAVEKSPSILLHFRCLPVFLCHAIHVLYQENKATILLLFLEQGTVVYWKLSMIYLGRRSILNTNYHHHIGKLLECVNK